MLNELRKKDIIDKCNEEIQLWNRQYFIWTKVRNQLKLYEGKTLNRRIVSAAQIAVGPAYTVAYDNQYTWLGLNIWGNGIDYNNAVRFMFGYKDKTKLFSLELMDKHSKGYETIPERILELEKRIIKLDNYISKYNQIKESIKQLEIEVGNAYPLSRYFEF